MSKVILITGASSGFGKDAALALIHQGFTVYGAARRVDEMQSLVDAGGYALKMDVTDMNSVVLGVDAIITEQGRIDVLINNAGFGVYGFVETTDIDSLKRMYDVNVWGLVRVTQQVLPHMRSQKSGHIVNISSMAGKISPPVIGFYASTKHSVEAISDATRQEVSSFGINVTIIEPGPVKTGFEQAIEIEQDAHHLPEDYQTKYKNFIKYLKTSFDEAPSSKEVVSTVVKVVKSNRTKTRYPVGFQSKGALTIKKILGDKLFDKFLASQMEG